MPDRVAHLEGLLTLIDTTLRVAEPRVVAALSREKRLILAELDSLAGMSKGSTVDQLAQRRATRRTKAKVVDAADGSAVERGKRGGRPRGGGRSAAG